MISFPKTKNSSTNEWKLPSVMTPPLPQKSFVSKLPSYEELANFHGGDFNEEWGGGHRTKHSNRANKKDKTNEFRTSIEESIEYTLAPFGDLKRAKVIGKNVISEDPEIQRKIQELEHFTEEEQRMILDRSRVKYAQLVIDNPNDYTTEHVARQKFEMARFYIKGKTIPRNLIFSMKLLESVATDITLDFQIQDSAWIWIAAIKKMLLGGAKIMN